MPVEVVFGDEGGRPVVVKRATDGEGAARLDAEAAVLGFAAGTGVPTVVRHHRAPDGTAALVLHRVGTRSLAVLRTAPEAAAGIAAGLCTTLARLHDLGLGHGAVEPAHVVLDPAGAPVLCGFGSAGPLGADGRSAAADVHGVGLVLASLLGASAEDGWEPIPERRWGRRRGWSGWARGALLTLADQAGADDPAARPGVRALAAALHDLVPDLAVPTPLPPPPLATPVARAAPPPSPEPAPEPESGTWPEPEPETWPEPDAVEADPIAPYVVAPDVVDPDPIAPYVVAPDVVDPDVVRCGPEPGEVDEVAAPGPADADDVAVQPVLRRRSGAARPAPALRRPRVAPTARSRPPGRPGAGRWALLGAGAVGLGLVAFGVAALVGAPSGAPPLPVAGPAPSTPAAPAPSDVVPPASDPAPDPTGAAPTTATTEGAGCRAGPAACVPEAPVTATADGTAVVELDGTRYAVGRAGDLVLVADWDCDGATTPAALRPATGEVFVFDGWARPGSPVEVAPVAVVPGATELQAGPPERECPGLRAVRPDGPVEVPA